MDLQSINGYFQQYGGIAVFVIVLLEYCNLPGFPAGIIMPLAGIWAAKGNLGFWSAIWLSVAAGMLGSVILYLIGRCGGELFLRAYLKRFPSHRGGIEKALETVRRNGGWGVFLSKLLPMIRTVISIPAGVLRMPVPQYLVSTLAGVFLWNLFFVGSGYLGGEAVLQYFHIM